MIENLEENHKDGHFGLPKLMHKKFAMHLDPHGNDLYLHIHHTKPEKLFTSGRNSQKLQNVF